MGKKKLLCYISNFHILNLPSNFSCHCILQHFFENGHNCAEQNCVKIIFFVSYINYNNFFKDLITPIYFSP